MMALFFRTNIPKEVMCFPDFSFPSHLPSFTTHEDVLKYLQDYTTHHNLKPFIKFRTRVEQVEPVPLKTEQVMMKSSAKTQRDDGEVSFHDWGKFTDNVRWKVTTLDMDSGKISSEEYDAVLLCVG